MTPNGTNTVTLCRVRGCGWTHTAPPLSIPIIGQPNQQVVEYVTKLIQHVQEKHPPLGNRTLASTQEFMGYLFTDYFKVNDPSVIQMREVIRAQLHKATRKNSITDAEIKDRLSRLPIDGELFEKLEGLLQDMRDVLLEEGRYAPQLPEQKPLVTA
jgi:hypothetical protein